MKKKWVIVIVVVALLIGGLIGFLFSGKAETPGTAGTIQVPSGPKIKVVFNGPPELEVNWEKLGMENFQLHLVGSLRNVSNQTVKFTGIEFFLDDTQVGFILPPSMEGWSLKPGEEAKIMKGLTGFSETSKVLEVRIEGFEKVGGEVTTPSPTPQPTEEEPKPTTEPTQLVYKENPKTPGEIAITFWSLFSEGKFEEARNLVSPTPVSLGPEEIALAQKSWDEEVGKGRTLIRVEITEEKIEGDSATVSGLLHFSNGENENFSGTLKKIGGKWVFAD